MSSDIIADLVPSSLIAGDGYRDVCKFDQNAGEGNIECYIT
jgi:hypothetical protein